VALEVEEVGWCTGVIFVFCGSEKPQFPQGSWGGSTAEVDFGQYARAASGSKLAPSFPLPINY
jgi:hypothetical protein